MAAEARLTLEAETARNEGCAATSLLNTICDAVVEVDSSLAIVGAASQFACMVSLEPNRCLEGVPFDRYVAERDRARFTENLTCRPDTARMSLANVFHLTLKDGLHNEIRAEVFHVPMKREAFRVDRSERHLLGVREFGEEVIGRRKSAENYIQSSPGEASTGVQLAVQRDYDVSSAGEQERMAVSVMTASAVQTVESKTQADGSRSVRANHGNALHCSAEVHCPCCEEQGQVLVVACDPITNQTCFQCNHHSRFWGEVVEAEAQVIAAYSLCVETFSCHQKLDTMAFVLNEVALINCASEDLRGAQAKCEVKLQKQTTNQDTSNFRGVSIMAVATLSPADPARSVVSNAGQPRGHRESRSSSHCSDSSSGSSSGRSSYSRKSKRSQRSRLECVAEQSPSFTSPTSPSCNLATNAARDRRALQPVGSQPSLGQGPQAAGSIAITFNPRTDQILDVYHGIPPRQILYAGPAYFWINMCDASADTKEAFLTCFEIFERHPELGSMSFNLLGMRCVDGDLTGQAEVPAKCEMLIKRFCDGRGTRDQSFIRAVATLTYTSSPAPAGNGADATQHAASRSTGAVDQAHRDDLQRPEANMERVMDSANHHKSPTGPQRTTQAL